MLGMTVSELECRMTDREFAEWGIFFTVEPAPDRKEDILAAMTCRTIMQSVAVKGTVIPKIDDFMLDWDELAEEGIKDRPKKSTEHMWAMAKAWALASGAKIEKGK